MWRSFSSSFLPIGSLFLLSYWFSISSFLSVLYFLFPIGSLFLLSYWFFFLLSYCLLVLYFFFPIGSLFSSFLLVLYFFFPIGSLFLLSDWFFIYSFPIGSFFLSFLPIGPLRSSFVRKETLDALVRMVSSNPRWVLDHPDPVCCAHIGQALEQIWDTKPDAMTLRSSVEFLHKCCVGVGVGSSVLSSGEDGSGGGGGGGGGGELIEHIDAIGTFCLSERFVRLFACQVSFVNSHHHRHHHHHQTNTHITTTRNSLRPPPPPPPWLDSSSHNLELVITFLSRWA
jgi:hypothetical protein